MRKPLKLEGKIFSTSSVCRIVGENETTFRFWLNEYDLFSEIQGGRGHYFAFRISHVMKAAAVRRLISLGFTVRAAVQAIQPFALISGLYYGDSNYVLQRSASGRWVPMDGAEGRDRLTLDLFVLWSEIRSRLIEEAGSYAVAEFEVAIGFAPSEAA